MTDWLAVDWGTSHLRVWGMSRDGAVKFRKTSDAGMGHLTRDQFEPALLDLVGEALETDRTPVVICGMAGSRQGWAEAKYVAVPCAPPGIDRATPLATRDPRLTVHILPGVKQTSPADVMRGEETQIAGFLALNPKFDGIICLPGTHTKWAHISAGEIVSFRTFMTGEMFALLSEQSVLRHSVAEMGWDPEAFADAVSTAMSNPSDLAARLFSIRAEGLLNNLDAHEARARLSGLLIGAELAAARPYWLGQHVALIGDDALCKAYADALGAQGLPVKRTDAERMTLEGLKAAYEGLKERAT
ncbi:2-dehydro-3-deoxygalactonokinase [Marivita hallyeonensis]|uniref:2-dehydro-3-deoxygalactonokinase n=1 Tax=Marivita hallyeonensis TaxID=996342 RepID=A0A1M5QHM9_9RHOB|nr:2-dehydro-3-deoxygalactonokinase [Marivita hallyeonensis]SHH13406.1 2-dehydro-3-deoxygalactonokinase [Marivita hallyeonensis]